jgi:PKD repeat protein
MEKNPIVTFQNPGSYQIMLEVFGNGYNATIRPGYITVLAPGEVPPAALFTANVTSGTAPLTVQFNDTSEGDPMSWSWSFGDGMLSTLKNPEHTYTTSGTFSVSLTVINAGGSDGTTKPGFITVFPKGDFNNNWRVDIGDVTRVAYMAVGFIHQDPRADFHNGNGTVLVGDAAKIAWYYVGKIPEL